MAERNCTSEVPVTSWERNCARFSCHDSVSPGRQYYYFSAERSLSVVLSFKKENRGDFIFGVAGVYLLASPVRVCPFQHSLPHTDIFPPRSTAS